MLKLSILFGLLVADLAANSSLPQLVRSNHLFTPNSYQVYIVIFIVIIITMNMIHLVFFPKKHIQK